MVYDFDTNATKSDAASDPHNQVSPTQSRLRPRSRSPSPSPHANTNPRSPAWSPRSPARSRSPSPRPNLTRVTYKRNKLKPAALSVTRARSPILSNTFSNNEPARGGSTRGNGSSSGSGSTSYLVPTTTARLHAPSSGAVKTVRGRQPASSTSAPPHSPHRPDKRTQSPQPSPITTTAVSPSRQKSGGTKRANNAPSSPLSSQSASQSSSQSSQGESKRATAGGAAEKHATRTLAQAKRKRIRVTYSRSDNTQSGAVRNSSPDPSDADMSPSKVGRSWASTLQEEVIVGGMLVG